MLPTTATTHHGGWRQFGASVVGGGDVWLGEKKFKEYFVKNELKGPKKNMSFFVLSIFGGWVGQTQIWINLYFF